MNPNPADPWVGCSLGQFCNQTFADGNCDVQCNSAACLYDGGDCRPMCPIQDECEKAMDNGQCSPECNTQECPYDNKDCGGSSVFVSTHSK